MIENLWVSCSVLNRFMSTYTELSLQHRATQQAREFTVALASHCTYELTLHTRLRVAGMSPRSRRECVYRAQAAMRYFQPRLFRAVSGNSWLRYEHKMPVFIPALEGIYTDRDRFTLHWHLLLGNLPSAVDTERLMDLARHIWTAHDDAGTDIEAQPLYDAKGFGDYITKELSTINYDCIDYEFLKAPKHIIDRLTNCS